MNRKELCQETLSSDSNNSEFKWYPNEKRVKEIYKDFDEHYKRGDLHLSMPTGYETIIEDFSKIAVFLETKEIVFENLKKLNLLLIKEADLRHLTFEVLKTTKEHYKVLSSVLERELGHLGFESQFAKAKAFLSRNTFLWAVNKGFLIKDPGAGEGHGEFSHAIQWLLVGWQQTHRPFLSCSVIELYKMTADKRSILSSKTDNDTNSIWDLVVDRFKKTEKSFRCPAILNDYIRASKSSEIALLKELCVARYEKREQQGLDAFMNEALGTKSEITSKKYPKKEYIQSNLSEHLFLPKKMST